MASATEPKDLAEAIRAVLLEHWNPIGIGDDAKAGDEYDAYVAHILSMLLRGAPNMELVAYLLAAETRSIGVKVDRDRVNSVAAMLHQLPRPERMTLGGVRDLLPFLKFLDDRRIRFTFGYSRPEALTVEITLVGVRLEVDFFDDHIEYSYFTGDEGALDDQKQLFDLIIERGT